MVSEHSVEENPIPQQSKKKAQGEQQASDSNQYICITCIEVVWSRSPLRSFAHKRYLRSAKGKTQISRENGHKRPAPVTDSAISNTSEEEDEELGEDLGGLDDLLAAIKSRKVVTEKVLNQGG